MSEKVSEQKSEWKSHYSTIKHFVCKQNNKKHNFSNREPIRDFVDFSKNIHRAIEPIRDLVDSRDSEATIPSIFVQDSEKVIFPESVPRFFQDSRFGKICFRDLEKTKK